MRGTVLSFTKSSSITIHNVHLYRHKYSAGTENESGGTTIKMRNVTANTKILSFDAPPPKEERVGIISKTMRKAKQEVFLYFIVIATHATIIYGQFCTIFYGKKNEPTCQCRKCKTLGNIKRPSAEYKYFGELLRKTSHSSNSRRPTKKYRQQHEAFGNYI